jgi:hypothetical protein
MKVRFPIKAWEFRISGRTGLRKQHSQVSEDLLAIEITTIGFLFSINVGTVTEAVGIEPRPYGLYYELRQLVFKNVYCEERM